MLSDDTIYNLPLLAAGALTAAALALGALRLARQPAAAAHARILVGTLQERLFIPLLSLAVFAGGAILMFSGALPVSPGRLRWLSDQTPLALLEASHFVGSLAGMGLMLLARGLQRRLDAAYILTLTLLAVGAAASLFKSFDIGQASLLAMLFLALLPGRRLFFRKASLFSEGLTVGWAAAILAVVGASIWLGLFAYRHVNYTGDLWWHFSVMGQASRFLRATVGAVALALLFGLARLLRPAPPKLTLPPGAIPDAIPAIVRQSPHASAHLAMLGDKQFLINAKNEAFIMYAISGSTWVAMGDPVGPPDQWAELIRQFRREADRFGDRAVFYEVGHEHLHLYLDAGLTLLKLGEEARVPLADFSLSGGQRRNLRHLYRRLTKEGCRFSIWSPDQVDAGMQTLKTVSDGWLAGKHTREKGFSLGFFNPAYLKRMPAGVVLLENRIVAFTNIWESSGREEAAIDLARYSPDEAPKGVMEYLFVEMMFWAARQGYKWFNLGMAPMSGMSDSDAAPLWHRFGTAVARFGEHFYNFKGLHSYKAKFDPVWQPKYLACPGGLALPRVLADIGALVSGGLTGVLFK